MDNLISCYYNSLYYEVLIIWCSSDFLAADPEIPGSIPGAATFSE
jgi:hypothetical protein